MSGCYSNYTPIDLSHGYCQPQSCSGLCPVWKKTLRKSAKKRQVYRKLHPDYEDILVVVSTKERPEAAVASSK